MNIRTRLAIAVAVVILATVAVLGFAAVRSTRAALMDEADHRVKETYSRFNRDLRGETEQLGGPGFQDTPVAVIVVDGNGDEVWVTKSGYGANPDEPPVIPYPQTDLFQEMLKSTVDLTSDDEGTPYRAKALKLENVSFSGVYYPVIYYIFAVPTDDIDETVSDLVRSVTIIAGIAVVLASAAVWFVIRHGMQPVEKMIDTASAIAGGDLSQRVPGSAVDSHTELGRLGGALNEMLSQIEHSSNLRDESEARLRQFVADAAHELRTPLTSLRGYAELYRQGALRDEAAVGSAMGRIESEGTRMARLVDELLLLARLDQQRGLELSRVDIVEICREALTDFRAVEPNRVITDAIGGSAIVLGDRLRLRQIVDNLLTNTRVHTPPGTPVRLATGVANGEVRIEVHDDGPGIPREDQQHVFERFWRGDRSRGRRAGSSGLGLSIVSSLVESHGGRIRLASEPGRGTTFIVTIPLDTSAGGATRPVPDPGGQPRGPVAPLPSAG